MQDWTATSRHGVTRNERTRRSKHKSPQKEPIINRCLLILRLKPFRSQIIGKHSSECSCARKETIDTEIHVISKNGDRKNYVIYKNNEQTSLERKGMEPVDTDQMIFYQSNTYRKDLSQLQIGNEPRFKRGSK